MFLFRMFVFYKIPIVFVFLQLVVRFVIFLGFLESGSVDATGFQEFGEAFQGPLSVVIDHLKK